MSYAAIEDVAAGFRDLTTDEQERAMVLLGEAAIMIDAAAASAEDDVKRLVSCRMVRRAIGDGASAFPVGATQGSMSAGGYSQSWTYGNGSSGELYISKVEKKLLGCSNAIGSHSPIEDLVDE